MKIQMEIWVVAAVASVNIVTQQVNRMKLKVKFDAVALLRGF